MWSWLQMCDILGSVLILLGLWNAPKHRFWWLVYCTGSGFFLYVVISKGLIGLTIMGIATFITGLKNAWKDQKVGNNQTKQSEPDPQKNCEKLRHSEGSYDCYD